MARGEEVQDKRLQRSESTRQRLLKRILKKAEVSIGRAFHMSCDWTRSPSEYFFTHRKATLGQKAGTDFIGQNNQFIKQALTFSKRFINDPRFMIWLDCLGMTYRRGVIASHTALND